jgi:chromate transporter
MSELGHLAAIFGQLSVLAVGGVAPVLPEMQRQVVDVQHYMDRPTFAALFGLAQAAPGPNMMVSTLIGWRVAGVPGALAATGAMIGPSSVLTYITARLWHRFRERRWRRLVQAGLVPVTVGLVAAGAALLAASTTHGVLTAAITLATAGLVVFTRWHPLWMLAAGAVLGAVFA